MERPGQNFFSRDSIHHHAEIAAFRRTSVARAMPYIFPSTNQKTSLLRKHSRWKQLRNAMAVFGLNVAFKTQVAVQNPHSPAFLFHMFPLRAVGYHVQNNQGSYAGFAHHGRIATPYFDLTISSSKPEMKSKLYVVRKHRSPLFSNLGTTATAAYREYQYGTTIIPAAEILAR